METIHVHTPTCYLGTHSPECYEFAIQHLLFTIGILRAGLRQVGGLLDKLESTATKAVPKDKISV